MRIYLAGPMRGIPRWNFDKFHEVAKDLRRRGHIVISPAEIDEALGLDPDDYPNLPEWWTIEAALALDFAAIDRSDAVVFMEGWVDSSGALQEKDHAVAAGKYTYRYFAPGVSLYPMHLSSNPSVDTPKDVVNHEELPGNRVKIRQFESGANRDTAKGKLDIEAALDPGVLEGYVGYLDSCAVLADGTKRSPDNWKKGMPKDVYAKSLTRHFWEWWKARHRGEFDKTALHAMMFNIMGQLYEEQEGR